MTQVEQNEFTFLVKYGDAELELRGFTFEPSEGAREGLPPVVFNSGFTGGVSMYGQLFGNALARRGYRVVTYDVAGFFTNRDRRNTNASNGVTATNISLEDQKTELLALIDWTRKHYGAAPAVISWAMGSSASLAAVSEIARNGGEQIAFYIPMSYTRLSALQNLRADAVGAHVAISALNDDALIPPFDTGTEATRLGYYPLDPDTQGYVDTQLGSYTRAGGVDPWPGCTHVTARSYKSYVNFDPENQLAAANGNYPPALIVHGKLNTLHMPAESIRLHQVYPGPKGDGPLLVEDMEHGQQLVEGNPVFETLIDRVDTAIRGTRG